MTKKKNKKIKINLIITYMHLIFISIHLAFKKNKKK